MRVLGLSGSLREGSHNTRLLRAAALALPPGGELGLYGSLRGVPPFDEDAEGAMPVPAAVAALRGKPVAVVGASTGPFGAVWAQADLRRVLGVIGADVLDASLSVLLSGLRARIPTAVAC